MGIDKEREVPVPKHISAVQTAPNAVKVYSKCTISTLSSILPCIFGTVLLLWYSLLGEREEDGARRREVEFPNFYCFAKKLGSGSHKASGFPEESKGGVGIHVLCLSVP